MQRMIGVIGGSGVYKIEGLEGASWVKVKTPWGKPSDEVLVGRLAGLPMAFLPRHGRGHVHSPSSVPYRANIDALKRLGCTDVLAISAVGSLRIDYAPGDFALVDQYIDRTFAREKSFFGPGLRRPCRAGPPHLPAPRRRGRRRRPAAGVKVHDTGTYVAMEGPQFSTLAESRLYRSWGADVIGMTAMPEAKLAREAELCYASLAMVTDYDCWHEDHGAVDVSVVLQTLAANSTAAADTVAALPAHAAPAREPCPHGCDTALTHALMTAPDKRDPELLAKLDAVAGRLL